MAFTPKFKVPAIFAMVEPKIFGNKKSTRCALTGTPIDYGALMYVVKFSAYNDAERFSVSEAASLHPGFQASVDNLERCAYPTDLMFYSDLERAEMVDQMWAKSQSRLMMMEYVQEKPSLEAQESWAQYYFSISRAEMLEEQKRLTATKDKYLSGDQIWKQLLKNINILEKDVNSEEVDKAWSLLGVIVLCDLHPRLVEIYNNLTPELRVVLSCSDNPIFAKLAEDSGLLPNWTTIFEIIGHARLSLADMLALAKWGKSNPDSLALLWKTHMKFGLLSFNIAPKLGFRKMLSNGHSAYLLFLFSSREDLCPMLRYFEVGKYHQNQNFIDQYFCFVPSIAYQSPYLYRSKAISALLDGRLEEASKIAVLMRKHVQHYMHGSPTGFINATEKMVKDYRRKIESPKNRR